jgi:hypothetical protein
MGWEREDGCEGIEAFTKIKAMMIALKRGRIFDLRAIHGA